jgi:hypothetical protein
MVSKSNNIKLKVRRLNQGQLDVLLKLYEFRFGTRELIAGSLGKQNGTAVYSRLSILDKQGYVAMRFDNSYKLKGRPAEYYLTPHALRLLKEQIKPEGLEDSAIKNSYRSPSDDFVARSLTIYAFYNRLTNLYDGLRFYTKRDMVTQDYFPKPLPDAFISLKLDTETRRFLLELVTEDSKAFTVDWRLRQLIEYYQDGEWQARGGVFPPILYVCKTGAIEKRVRKQIIRALSQVEAYILFYTTTERALLNSRSGDDEIWSNTKEPEKLYNLVSLPINP